MLKYFDKTVFTVYLVLHDTNSNKIAGKHVSARDLS